MAGDYQLLTVTHGDNSQLGEIKLGQLRYLTGYPILNTVKLSRFEVNQ